MRYLSILILFTVTITPLKAHEAGTFEAELRRWLLANPEILLEMSAELEQRQFNAQASLDAGFLEQEFDALFHDARDARSRINEDDGTATIIEFLDYNCGYCRRQYGALQDALAAAPNLQIIFKEFPIWVRDQLMRRARYWLLNCSMDKRVITSFMIALCPLMGKSIRL